MFDKQLHFFKEALLHDKLAHGYILSGLDDVEVAKDIVKHIFCKQEHSACGSCSSCVKFASQNLADYMEVSPDGASIKNAQVEEVRRFILTKPFESRRKVVLFTQSELITEQAQNKLLKVLEEPPGHALFLFMTTNAEKLLDTVKSRTQWIDFSSDDSETSLDEVVREKLETFVLSLEYKDAGALFDFGQFSKKDKVLFAVFLERLIVLLRDILCIKETRNDALISRENKVILSDTHSKVRKLVDRLSSKDLLKMILAIDEAQLKFKNNMNYDLTVDQLLFECID